MKVEELLKLIPPEFFKVPAVETQAAPFHATFPQRALGGPARLPCTSNAEILTITPTKKLS